MQQVATGYGLIEGPVWDPARGLYFSDVINGGVDLLGLDGKIKPVIPKRRGIGGMALHENGGLVVGGRDIACVSLADGTSRTLLSLDAIAGATIISIIGQGEHALAADGEGVQWQEHLVPSPDRSAYKRGATLVALELLRDRIEQSD